VGSALVPHSSRAPFGATRAGIYHPSVTDTAPAGKWRAFRRGLCPHCRKGAIFVHRSRFGFPPMFQRCPMCNLRFEREPGYFLGAMVIGYALAVPVMGAFIALFWAVTGWSWGAILIVSALALLPFVPAITRWSRVVWIWFDRAVDPGD